ncbi:hypothetical protein H2198_001357 [Neophaeococcomyces mojaviensis]|uniref:Uncharacterized protein n=1 Tax=Neophaeococcomyces mojaviensis TaxID=3383035 RepID=A0ACC3AHS3_9EURO|nr:hypothetical protein H2198_001357 [Knufia sp. JES_112]
MSHTTLPTSLVESSIVMLRPPYDPLLVPAIEASKIALPENLNVENLRGTADLFGPDKILQDNPSLEHAEYRVPDLKDGDAEVILSVFRTKNSVETDRPALYHVHGGGQVAGNRFTALEIAMGYFAGIDAVFVSVEYRLAPEFRAPAALHDAYAGLLWTAEHSTELGIDVSKIILYGCSGGGPIAAGSAILCRNNQKLYPCALMLLTPMLDDRDSTVSSKQFARDGPWCGTTNRMAWDHVLGNERGGPNVSELVSPARAKDLAGLPPTFIDVGVCEVFRDEAVAFASRLWESGVSAELHAWPGGYHGFDMLAAGSPLANIAVAAKMSWVKRIVSGTGKK